MTWLLDGNALVAWTIIDHAHHNRMKRWLAKVKGDQLATCPLTEGTLLRLHMQIARDTSAYAAWAALSSIRAHPKHIFLPDNFSYEEVDPTRLTGYRQVTDAWLTELARRQGCQLATLDEALSVLWPQSTLLIPV